MPRGGTASSPAATIAPEGRLGRGGGYWSAARSSSVSGRVSSTYSPLGSWRMIPVSTPCSTMCWSLRCSPRQIRFVTQYATTGAMKTAYLAISVVT